MSVNKCLFIGNIGKIETRYMTNGEAVTNFSLALNESYKDKQGNKVEKTEWVNCVAYKKLAEIMAEYCKVGQQIFVECRVQTRKYQDKSGQDKYVTEFIANEMQMLGSKQSDDKPQQGVASAKASIQPKASDPFSDFDSNIPF